MLPFSVVFATHQKPARILLEAGETKHIAIALPVSQLSYYDVAMHKFIVSPGTFNVMIGSSADDVRLRTDLEIN